MADNKIKAEPKIGKPVAKAVPAKAPTKPAPAKAGVPKVSAPVASPLSPPAVPAAPIVVAPIVAAPTQPSIETPAIPAAPVPAPAIIDTPVATTTETTPAVAPAPVAPTPPILNTHKEADIMNDTINTAATTAHTATDKAQTMFVEMNDRAKSALEKTQGMFADMTEFNKGNVEALVESSKIAAKGIESMGQEAAEYTRKSFEGMTAVIKSLGSIKSPTEFMKLHSDYVRTSFDSMVAESSKNTEAMLKLAGEIAQPISNRVAVAAEKMKISA